jgi:hypothetical protein
MERLLATPKTIPSFPLSADISNIKLSRIQQYQNSGWRQG